ncbi:hypothetical protein TUSST3_57410 [Streptomyces sp. TUS-ST3]|uniref:STAS domain-containing protein n=1 Tax=Streptomyces sp. TUS-ST3 TaxID=3025591 RepID=UPI00235B47EB|nr:STAS domain-containing protein [Streptomyces sp. TUS-ST3]GLP69118.1 hypothetical protein TUSST3_57410 [Streptomyces sp. TUS-ST3]
MSRSEGAGEAVVTRPQAAGSAWVIALRGEFDFESSPGVDEAVTQALRTDSSPIVFDVTEVGFCDSQLLGSLLRAARERQVGLIGAGSLMRRLTEVTGTGHLLVHYADLDSACAALADGPQRG